MFKTLWKVASTGATVFTIYKQLQAMQQAAQEAQAYGLIDTSGFTNPLQALQGAIEPQTASQISQVKAGG